jgi:hypothetical protein
MDKLPETPTVRRRKPSFNQGDMPMSAGHSGRRPFFKHAASTESLRSRSLSQSQSLSQELSSVHSRKTSFSSVSNRSSPTSLSPRRINLSLSMPNTAALPSERTAASYENEIMRLQEVLKEREAEIQSLETSLKEAQETSSVSSDATPPPALKINGVHNDNPDILTPGMMDQFHSLRKTMENGHTNGDTMDEVSENGDVVPDNDASLLRLNELMLYVLLVSQFDTFAHDFRRSMAQKESKHKELVESLNSQLNQTKRQLDDLTTLSRDQVLL